MTTEIRLAPGIQVTEGFYTPTKPEIRIPEIEERQPLPMKPSNASKFILLGGFVLKSLELGFTSAVSFSKKNMDEIRGISWGLSMMGLSCVAYLLFEPSIATKVNGPVLLGFFSLFFVTNLIQLVTLFWWRKPPKGKKIINFVSAILGWLLYVIGAVYMYTKLN